MHGDTTPDTTEPTAPPGNQGGQPAPEPVAIADATDFDPLPGTGAENPEAVPNALDEDPASFWHTDNYYGPGFGNLKPGVGIVLDLGEQRNVRTLTVDAVGETSVEFRAAPGATDMPDSADDFTTIAQGTGESLTLQAQDSVETQFVLVWLTELPMGDDGNYRGRISSVSVSG
jgi:hypothetical protein